MPLTVATSNASSADPSAEYKPSSSGSWGLFPRPKDISKAYGGGRKLDPYKAPSPEVCVLGQGHTLHALVGTSKGGGGGYRLRP